MLTLCPYLEQAQRWPSSGRQILAQFDDESVIVYQAFCDAIANYALEHQRFGGPFLLDRMSWIKPGFLWMMYRSQWSLAKDQERVLAIRVRRPFFEDILSRAVPSTYWAHRYATRSLWQQAMARSDVRLQWDPDHDPAGHKLARRAIQLGLRGQALEQYAVEGILGIEDLTSFVREQANHAHPPYEDLTVPVEEVYQPESPRACSSIGIGGERAEAPKALPEVSRHRFRTAREAFDWIKWDPAFDRSDFAIGYDAHEGEPVEIEFDEFVALGEIPLHRVLYIRAGAQIVWDRRERIDRLGELRVPLKSLT